MAPTPAPTRPQRGGYQPHHYSTERVWRKPADTAARVALWVRWMAWLLTFGRSGELPWVWQACAPRRSPSWPRRGNLTSEPGPIGLPPCAQFGTGHLRRSFSGGILESPLAELPLPRAPRGGTGELDFRRGTSSAGPR